MLCTVARPRHLGHRVRLSEIMPGLVTVWIYSNKEVGDVDHLKVFANEDAAERWFTEHDPEGVAFEYPVAD